jgi:periplasmic mercuric ion binding protein
MKTIIATLLLAASLSAQAAQTLKAEVNGMVCAFCAQGIEKKLRALAQTKDVYVNLKQRIVAVELRDGQTLAPQTVRDLVKDAGYDVVSIETVSQSVGELKAGGGK